MVEHFLHTVSENEGFAKAQRSNDENAPLRPDFRPDPGAKKRLSARRFLRIGRGLYRYAPTGEIYNCRKVGEKNRWQKLNTKDKKIAMAIAAVTSYSDAQNGNHQVALIPDELSKVPVTISGGEIKAVAVQPISTPSVSAPVARTLEAKVVATRSMTIRAMIEELKAQWQHLAPSTRKVREAYLNALSEHFDVNNEIATVTPSMIRRVRGALAQGRKPTTVNDIMTKALRPLLDLAVEVKMLEQSPLITIKALRKERPIRLQPTWTEAQALIGKVAESAPESAQLLRFMLFFGVGQAEIKGCRGEHVDLKAGCVHFFREKTKKEFTVPIYTHAQGFVKTLERDGQLKTGVPIFSWRNPRKALASACDALKIPSYSPRALRRTFIIHCLEKGVDPRVVASWQGHSDARLILTTYGSFISADHARLQAAKLG